MELATVLAALISAVGTLAGALGGIALTGGLESRRQQLAASRAEASEREAAHAEARDGLVSAITRLRVDVEVACARHWRDMNVRLDGIHEEARDAGVQASRVALVSRDQEEAEAALGLGRCAGGLAAWTAKRVSLGEFDGPGRQMVAGQIVDPPDFAELDEFLAVFSRVSRRARESPGPGGVPPAR